MPQHITINIIFSLPQIGFPCATQLTKTVHVGQAGLDLVANLLSQTPELRGSGTCTTIFSWFICLQQCISEAEKADQ